MFFDFPLGIGSGLFGFAEVQGLPDLAEVANSDHSFIYRFMVGCRYYFIFPFSNVDYETIYFVFCALNWDQINKWSVTRKMV